MTSHERVPKLQELYVSCLPGLVRFCRTGCQHKCYSVLLAPYVADSVNQRFYVHSDTARSTTRWLHCCCCGAQVQFLLRPGF
jgi:hypothetical protein